MGSRKELLKKALGIPEYPWSSDDEEPANPQNHFDVHMHRGQTTEHHPSVSEMPGPSGQQTPLSPTLPPPRANSSLERDMYWTLVGNHRPSPVHHYIRPAYLSRGPGFHKPIHPRVDRINRDRSFDNIERMLAFQRLTGNRALRPMSNSHSYAIQAPACVHRHRRCTRTRQNSPRSAPSTNGSHSSTSVHSSTGHSSTRSSRGTTATSSAYARPSKYTCNLHAMTSRPRAPPTRNPIFTPSVPPEAAPAARSNRVHSTLKRLQTCRSSVRGDHLGNVTTPATNPVAVAHKRAPQVPPPLQQAPLAPEQIPLPAPVVPLPAPVLPLPAPVLPQPAPVIPLPAPVVALPAPVVPLPAPVVTPPLPVVTPPLPVVAPPSQVVVPPSPVVAPPSPVVASPSQGVALPSPVVAPLSPLVVPPSPVVAPPSPVVAPPSPVVVPKSPVVAPPSPAVAPPPQVVASPSQVVAPPPQVVASPAQVVAPPSQVVVPPSQVVAPPSQVVAPPSQVVAPPSQVVAPPSQVVAPPSQVVAPPWQVVAPPSLVVAPPSLVVAPLDLARAWGGWGVEPYDVAEFPMELVQPKIEPVISVEEVMDIELPNTPAVTVKEEMVEIEVPDEVDVSVTGEGEDVADGGVGTADVGRNEAAAASANEEAGALPQKSQESKTTREGDDAEPFTFKEFNQSLLRLLECPVCLEWMEPPMSQCRRGHLVCGRCRARLASCPVCRTTFSSVRNRAMEGVAEMVRYPCRHGCGREVRLRRRATHEASCGARRYHCPAPLCAQRPPMPQNHLYYHFQSKHMAMLKIGRKHKFSMKVNSEQHDTWLITALHEYFYLRIDVDIRTWGVVVYVAYIGPKCNANRYMYEVSVLGQHNSRKLVYARATHSDLENSSLNVSRQDCFHLTLDQALNFLRFKNRHCEPDKFLDFDVEISKCERVLRDDSDS